MTVLVKILIGFVLSLFGSNDQSSFTGTSHTAGTQVSLQTGQKIIYPAQRGENDSCFYPHQFKF